MASAAKRHDCVEHARNQEAVMTTTAGRLPPGCSSVLISQADTQCSVQSREVMAQRVELSVSTDASYLNIRLSVGIGRISERSVR